jgi:hypothetical protein
VPLILPPSHIQCLKNGALKADLVCFTGGISPGNIVSTSAAGYLFFRHMCEHQGVDLGDMDFYVESMSSCAKEAMRNVVERVMAQLDGKDTRRERTTRPNCYFTIISNEYQLSSIHDTHQVGIATMASNQGISEPPTSLRLPAAESAAEHACALK